MQQALRPYATAGVVLVGASLITAAPIAIPPPEVQSRPVQLVDAWSDLFANTNTNVQNIIDNADLPAITGVIAALFTNPLGVISALTDVTPDVTTDLGSLPAQISVDLPPGLSLGLAQLGTWVTTTTAINEVVGQAMTNPASLFEGIATILNAYLNGQDELSLLGGTITLPAFNGILAPLQTGGVDLNLLNLVDALGLGNTLLTDLDLSSLLDQLGLGELDLGGLFSALGLSDEGLGDLLGDPTLGGLLSVLGLGDLGLGSFSLTNLLTDLGLDETLGQLSLTDLLDGLGLNANLGSFGLTALLDDLGLNTNLGDVTLTALLDALGLNINVSDLSLTDVISGLFGGLNVGNVGLGGLLDSLGLGNLTLGNLIDLNSILGGLGLGVLLGPVINALTNISLDDIVNGLTLGNGGPLDLTTLLGYLGLGGTTSGDLGSITDLLTALGINLPSTGDLDLSDLITSVLGQLGIPIPSTGDLTIEGLLTALGVPIPLTGDLTISSLLTDVLGQLGLPIPVTGDLSLADLLGSLDVLNLPVGDLLNNLNLGDLLDLLDLSNLPLDLSNLGDLSNLSLGDLLGDLGLGDLANIGIDPFGGMTTLLVDFIPQQILDALGM
ncbi:hypothetical protein [Mycobacterium shimoidei]|uniref:hypothetical protein n=1 Tax=Mycobacterium shimoidei TaxID=29313 RepID=UPI000A69EB41|nr:hypothetical protein [Mycobacterium shimoidei]MCV7259044.1 hypothetical protein [Mycobacterium shimoidei]